jgi:hypothetical protein
MHGVASCFRRPERLRSRRSEVSLPPVASTGLSLDCFGFLPMYNVPEVIATGAPALDRNAV